MKKLLFVPLLFVLGLMFAGNASAWNCTNPLDARVAVPSGTTGTFGDGDGQLFLGVSGQGTPGVLYECEPVQPPTPPVTTPTTSNSTSSASAAANAAAAANSSSNSSSNQTQSQKQGQSQVANGGTANATGGSVGNVTSTSNVSNSGNSSNSNKNVAKGGTGGAGGSSVATASGNGVGNGDNSNDTSTVINNPKLVATAIAPPVFGANPCFKGVSGAAQTATFGLSFGGGKIDENCAILEASRMAPSRIARCKVYLLNKYAKEAGVTFDDACPPEIPSVPVVIPAPPAPVFNFNVSTPAPIVTVIPAPAVAPAPSVAVAAAQIHHKAHVPCEPQVVPSGKKGCVVTNDSIKQ